MQRGPVTDGSMQERVVPPSRLFLRIRATKPALFPPCPTPSTPKMMQCRIPVKSASERSTSPAYRCSFSQSSPVAGRLFSYTLSAHGFWKSLTITDEQRRSLSGRTLPSIRTCMPGRTGTLGRPIGGYWLAGNVIQNEDRF